MSNVMKCLICGKRMTAKRKTHRYDAVGLPGVQLVGVVVARCPSCGEEEVVIPDVEGLHRAIAASVISKPARLTSAEVRFLRKHIGLSQADFAAQMGTAHETVSRWETGKSEIGTQADKLLRMIVATQRPPDHYPPLELTKVAVEAARPEPLRLRPHQEGWRMSA